MDDPRQIIIDGYEEEQQEPPTNLPGAILGVALFPAAAALVACYIKVVWCLVVRVWQWVNF